MSKEELSAPQGPWTFLHKLRGLLKGARSAFDFADVCHSLSRAERKTLAEMFFVGWIDSSGNHRYFKKGSREECAARFLVADMLQDIAENCNHPEWYVLLRIKDVFDPASVFARDIVLSFRREGNPGKRSKHHQIARHMRRLVRDGVGVDAAIKSAEEKFNLSRSAAYKIWGRYKHEGNILAEMLSGAGAPIGSPEY
jgi:hypothetical protein